jgi:hypothetical protein
MVESMLSAWIAISSEFNAALNRFASASSCSKVKYSDWLAFASSYPQLLVNRAPEIGGGQWLDIRKFFDLSRFRFQSRILEATPVNSRLAAR